MTQSLLELTTETYPGTDKYDLGYIHEFYDRLFTPKKESAQSVLEIGVNEGNSILLWKNFFANAKVTGIDTHPVGFAAAQRAAMEAAQEAARLIPPDPSQPMFPTMPTIDPPSGKLADEARVEFIMIDAYTQACLDVLKDRTFDIMIDDGTHGIVEQKFFMQNYLPMLNAGGILIVEDILDQAYTTQLTEGIDQSLYTVTVIDTRSKQKTPELLEMWKNGLWVITVEKKS